MWLLQADLQRLDSFQAKCLRQIYKIPSSYISRISNQTVLDMAWQSPLSTTIAERQQKLYKQIAAMPTDHPLRQLTCEKNNDRLKLWEHERRRGRPKQNWAHCVYAMM